MKIMAGLSIEPSFNFVAITKSDTVPISYNGKPARAKAFYIGGAGNIAIKSDATGAAVVFEGCLAGTVLPISSEFLYATDTSATKVVALF